MQRRQLLATGLFVLTGCLDGRLPGNGDGSPSPASPSDGTRVRIVSRADQPAIPIDYTAEMAAPTATMDHPARIRIGISNTTESPVAIAEERTVQFHHVSSTEETLYLYPAGDGAWSGPVDPGCWRLTEPVAVPEYYGVITLEGNETIQAESYVYGHQQLPEGSCLPDGDHRIRMSGVSGDQESLLEGTDTTDFEWGFTLRIGD